MRNYTMTGVTEHGCGCNGSGSMPDTSYVREDFALAMAYVPWQHFTTVFDTDKALEVGTIFPELEKPFLAGGRCCRR